MLAFKFTYLTEMDYMRNNEVPKHHEYEVTIPYLSSEFYRTVAQIAARQYDNKHPEDDCVVGFYLDLFCEGEKLGRFKIRKEQIWKYNAEELEE